jgi:hypothetical protein
MEKRSVDSEAILGELIQSNGLLKKDVFWTKIIAVASLVIATLSFFWTIQIYISAR